MFRLFKSQTVQLMLAWTIILLQDIQMNDTPGVFIAATVLFILLITAVTEKRISQITGEK